MTRAVARDATGNEKGGPEGPPFSTLSSLSWDYQVPPLVAEQPPLSAEPVAHVRVVVPLAARDRVNVAALESRLDVTTTV